MARLTVDLELEQVRAIVRDFDSVLDPVGFARLPGGMGGDVYRIDVAGAENPLVLKIYDDEPAWIVAKEALGHRFRTSNHIRQPFQACKSRCEQRAPD
jgi:hypothetical protein